MVFSTRGSRAFAVTIGLGSALLGAACDLDCLEMDCSRTGLDVSLTRADGQPLQDGEYRVFIANDAHPEAPEAFEALCTLQQLAQARCEFVAVGEGTSSSAPAISVAGDDMPRDIRIAWLTIADTGPRVDLGGPQTFSLNVELDGATLLQTQVSPKYSASEGADTAAATCGRCEYAEVEIEIPS